MPKVPRPSDMAAPRLDPAGGAAQINIGAASAIGASGRAMGNAIASIGQAFGEVAGRIGEAQESNNYSDAKLEWMKGDYAIQSDIAANAGEDGALWQTAPERYKKLNDDIAGKYPITNPEKRRSWDMWRETQTFDRGIAAAKTYQGAQRGQFLKGFEQDLQGFEQRIEKGDIDPATFAELYGVMSEKLSGMNRTILHQADVEAKTKEMQGRLAGAVDAFLSKKAPQERAQFWDSVSKGQYEIKQPQSVGGASGDVKSFLRGRLAPGYEGRTSDVETLHPVMQDRLGGFLEAAQAAGHDIRIISGTRSPERQAVLWKDAVAKYGSEAEARRHVAPPGGSTHQSGEAVDLQYQDRGSGLGGKRTAAVEWAHANAKKFGLNFPLGHEDWHIEPVEARQGGKRYGGTYGGGQTYWKGGAVGGTGNGIGAPSGMEPGAIDAVKSVASRIGADPRAISSVIAVESGWDKNNRTGSYRGLTQVGPDTLAEMGVSPAQYDRMSQSEQAAFYGRWLDHYKFSDKMRDAGIDFKSLPPARQAAVLQAFQFAPNGDWVRRLAGGDTKTPVTNTAQARALGSTSIADMERYFAGKGLGQNVATSPPLAQRGIAQYAGSQPVARPSDDGQRTTMAGALDAMAKTGDTTIAEAYAGADWEGKRREIAALLPPGTDLAKTKLSEAATLLRSPAAVSHAGPSQVADAPQLVPYTKPANESDIPRNPDRQWYVLPDDPQQKAAHLRYLVASGRQDVVHQLANDGRDIVGVKPSDTPIWHVNSVAADKSGKVANALDRGDQFSGPTWAKDVVAEMKSGAVKTDAPQQPANDNQVAGTQPTVKGPPMIPEGRLVGGQTFSVKTPKGEFKIPAEWINALPAATKKEYARRAHDEAKIYERQLKSDADDMMANQEAYVAEHGKNAPGYDFRAVEAAYAAEPKKIAVHARRVRTAQEINREFKDAADLPDDELVARIERLAPSESSPNYAESKDIFEKAEKRLHKLMKQREVDPGGSVEGSKDVMAVREKLVGGQPRNKLDQIALMSARLAAQRRLDISEDARNPLTADETRALAAPLRGLNPGDAMDRIEEVHKGIKEKYGDKYSGLILRKVIETTVKDKTRRESFGSFLTELDENGAVSPSTMARIREQEEIAAGTRKLPEKPAPKPASPGILERLQSGYRGYLEAMTPKEVSEGWNQNIIGPLTGKPAPGKPLTPPRSAIDNLRQNPRLAPDFERKYNLPAGSARKYLLQ